MQDLPELEGLQGIPKLAGLLGLPDVDTDGRNAPDLEDPRVGDDDDGLKDLLSDSVFRGALLVTDVGGLISVSVFTYP